MSELLLSISVIKSDLAKLVFSDTQEIIIRELRKSFFLSLFIQNTGFYRGSFLPCRPSKVVLYSSVSSSVKVSLGPSVSLLPGGTRL